MSEPKLTELVAALQLLMGDMPPENRAFVIMEAFPDLMLVAKGERADHLFRRMRSVEYNLRVAKETVDGSSGIGAGAARTAAQHVSSGHSAAREILNTLRVDPYT